MRAGWAGRSDPPLTITVVGSAATGSAVNCLGCGVARISTVVVVDGGS
ncbi:Uncharacterised protein [Mycobacteroides abscessus subsp. abscessus]|nr:Uncharacterised protein [Mycobacteroides abscessus subsp. abscessus]SKV24084.1 Uncharacterised protein [Mycobacteroides abscessus subsp. abscessus]